jgi:hypothetical protein
MSPAARRRANFGREPVELVDVELVRRNREPVASANRSRSPGPSALRECET